MNRNSRFIPVIVLILTALLCLSACSDPNLAVEEYSMIVTEEDISQLDMFPNLNYVDLRGSTCYEAIEDYIAAHPAITVVYSVQFGTDRADSTAEEITLNGRRVSFEDMLSDLKYLPNARRIMLLDTNFTIEQIQMLRTTYPDIVFEYSITLCDEEYPHNAQTVNLTQLSPDSITDAVAKLQMLPDVKTAELMPVFDQCKLSIENVKELQNALPNISFHYSFELLGKKVSTTDEVIEYIDMQIGNEAENEIRTALDVLDGCKVFKLDDCGIDDSVMARIQDDYPDKKIVWRLYFGKYSLLTDEEMIRINSKINDENSKYLKYCTNIKYMDISKNTNLTDFSFIASMPELRIAILTDTRINDLSVFSGCSALEWLELVRCKQVSDLSPLSGLSNLQYLNISSTRVSDITAIEGLPLKQFVCIKTNVPKAQRDDYSNAHPDCLCKFTGTNPLGAGWRLDEKGKNQSAYYEAMIPIFHYDDPKYTGNIKAE